MVNKVNKNSEVQNNMPIKEYYGNVEKCQHALMQILDVFVKKLTPTRNYHMVAFLRIGEGWFNIW